MSDDIRLTPLLTDDDQVEQYVADLPAEQVPVTLARVMVIAKAIRAFQKMLESRMVTQAVSGEVFTDSEGQSWMWSGDRKREVSDPAELRSLLLEQSKEWTSTIAKRALVAAFKDQPPKVYLTELDVITKWEPKARKLITEYTQPWKESPPHLRRMDEDGK